jgi:hypothetical protein
MYTGKGKNGKGKMVKQQRETTKLLKRQHNQKTVKTLETCDDIPLNVGEGRPKE